MLIRSQDKLMSVSYEAGLWAINGGDVRFLNLSNTDKWMVFGRYENQAKAIKVLDMIQERFHDIEISKMPDYDSGWVPFTFEMPQDTEVDT